MKAIITAAGFIGFKCRQQNLSSGHHIVGVLGHHRWTIQRSQCSEFGGPLNVSSTTGLV